MAKRSLFTYAADYADTQLFTVQDHNCVQKSVKSYSEELSPSTNFILEGALQEILEKMTKFQEEVRTSSKELQNEVCSRLKMIEDRLHNVQYQIDSIAVELTPKGPVFLYTFVPYDKVYSIYIKNQTSPSRFAAALEGLIYLDEPWELQIPLNQRVNSKERVEFLKNCVFRHFNVVPQLQEIVWKSIRADLDRRARRVKTSARSTPTSTFRASLNLLEILNYDSDS